MAFREGLRKLLEHKVGYEDRLPAGETYKGISRRWFPKWVGWEIIDSYDEKWKLGANEELQREVSDFYYVYFWGRINAHEIDSEFIAEMLFNFSVDMGKKVVIKKVQRVLGVKANGSLDENTLGVLNGCDEQKFVLHFLLEVVEFYAQLGKDQPQNLRKWLDKSLSFYYEYMRFHV